jgi:hypothetical protein
MLNLMLTLTKNYRLVSHASASLVPLIGFALFCFALCFVVTIHNTINNPRVRLEDCIWELQNKDPEAQPPQSQSQGNSNHEKELVLTLSKAVVQHRYEGDIWSGLLEGDDTVDTTKLAIDQ